MKSDEHTQAADVQKEHSQASDEQGISSFVEDLYKGVDGLRTGDKDAVNGPSKGQHLPALELSDKTGTGLSEKLDASIQRAPGNSLPESEAIRAAEAKILSPETSQEDKLRAAAEMAKEGQETFVGPDGRRYDISVEAAGHGSLVSIHTNDKEGKSQAVIRGIVDQDGSVTHQLDADGKEVPYQTRWAEKGLTDSPVPSSKERSDAPPPSEQQQKLHETLKEKGLEPPNQTEADRLKLAEEHGKLESKLAAEQKEYEALKKHIEAMNKPVEAEQAKLKAKIDELEARQFPLLKEVGSKNQQLAQDLKSAGIGDGKPMNMDHPQSFRKAREEIDSKIPDPEKRAQLKKQVDDLEKANVEPTRLDKELEKIDQQKQKLGEKIDHNNQLLSDKQTEVWRAAKELRLNEEKIKESKFGDDLKEIDKLPEAKREAVYKALDQIARDGGGMPNQLSSEERKQLVEQVAHQIAHPESIHQGNKGTCGLAATEFDMAGRYPEKYAQYMANLATKGESTTADGGKLRISPEMINIKDKDGHLVPHDDANPSRSLASKIFQTAAANRVLEERAKSANPPEQPSTYDTQRPGSKYPIELGGVDKKKMRDFRPSEDTGERIVKPDGKAQPWDGVDVQDLEKLTSGLTGEQYEAQPVVKRRDLSKPDQAAAARQDFIDQAEKNGLPMNLNITLLKGDFTGMNSEGGHELVITKIDKGPPAMVYYDNTASGTDHSYPTGKPVPLDTLIKSMQQTQMSDGNTHIEGYVIAKKK